MRESDENIVYRDRRTVSRVSAFRGLLDAQRVPMHEHPEIQFVVGSSRLVEVSWQNEIGRQSDRVMRPGEVAIIQSGQPHSFAWRASEMVSSVYIDPAHIEELQDGFGAPRSTDVRQNFGLVDPLMRELIIGIACEVSSGFPNGQSFADAAESCLVARAFQPQSQSPYGDRRTSALPKHVARAIDYIEAHFAEDVGVAELAAVAGLNRFHFAHSFKAATGQSPYQYLLQRRIREAKRLLMTDLPLAAMAVTLGFADQSHFTTRFRAITGVSPGDFRKNGRGNAQ